MSDEEWDVYHRIRRHVLFELRGHGRAYDANHPDERAPGHHPLVFWVGHAPVGVIRVDVRGAVAVFRRVAIRSDVQRRGYGRQLLDAAERFAQTHGCTRVESHVHPSATGFYDRCGYTRVESPTSGGAVFMTKVLAT